MQQFTWTKTLLKSYNYLDRLVGGIDESFNKISNSSFYYNSASYNSTYNLSNKLIDLNQRKVLLINTKVLVDKLLSKISDEGRKFLTLRYIDGVKNEEIATLCGCCIRTVTRKINTHLQKISELLEKAKFSNDRLLKIYKDEQWIMDIYYGDYEG